MANYFDQFDSAPNFFDQFDADPVRQIPGLEKSKNPDIKLNEEEQSKSILEKAREIAGGIGETAIGTVTGIPTAIGESVAQQFFGMKPGELSQKIHAFEPQTEKGQQYLNYIGEQAPALMGGIGHSTIPEIADRVRSEKNVTPAVANVLQKQAELDKAPAAPAKNFFDQFDETQQQPLFDINNQGEGANPYEAQQGYWTKDEKGIPIRADLSMEAQNLGDPLQRNLWGDELPVRENPVGQAAQLPMDRDLMGFPKMTEDPRRAMENDVNLTNAIDNIAKDDPARGEALNLLRDELEAHGELKSAKMEADTPTTERSTFTDPDVPKGVPGLDNVVVPRSQRGGINLPALTDIYKQLEKVLGKTDMIPEDSPVRPAIEASYGAKDIMGHLWQQVQSGGALTSIKAARVPFVKAGVDLIQNAVKRASLYERKHILPVENEFKRLSSSDLVSIGKLLKDEAQNRRRLSPEAVELLPGKLQKSYSMFRQMMDENLRLLNETRESQGLKPVDAHEAYLAHMWEGDHRRPLYEAILNEDGSPKINEKGEIQKKLVWYLAAHTKGQLDAQTAALMKSRPDLFFDKSLDHTVRFYKRQADIQSTLHQMIDVLGRDDPAVQRMLEKFGELTDSEAKNFLGQQKHFEPQTGVHGYIGDRPDTRGPIRQMISGNHEFNEVVSMLEHNFSYAKNSSRWAELQKAAPGIKEILTDARAREELPNALNYVREYWKNALGQNEARFISQLNDGLRDVMGVNTTPVHAGIQDLKGTWIVWKLMYSTGYNIMNMLQSSYIIPHLVKWEMDQFKGNWLTSIPVGNALGAWAAAKTMLAYPAGAVEGSLAMAKHYHEYWKEASKEIPQDTMGFYNRAFKYAEDNGITTNSIYNGAPVGHAFSAFHKGVDMAGHSISMPEGLGRSVAFFTAVEYLRSSGKFKNDIGLFQEAERLTNAAIADHRTTERPMWSHKLGWVGSMFDTLSTWPVNYINQVGLFGKEALKGNVAPFAAFLGVNYLLAGAMGIPGFRDGDGVYQWFKNKMLPTKWWMEAQQNDFWRDPKMWVMKNFGTPSIYGQVSDSTGLNLSTRLSAPAGGELMQNPLAPYQDAAEMAHAAAKAIYDPEKGEFFNRDSVAQAGMKLAPPFAQGMVENLPQLEGSTYDWRVNNQTGQKERLAMRPSAIDSHTAVYARNPSEDNLRYFGLRSNKEGMERDLGYRLDKDIVAAKDRSRSLPDEFYAALKTGNKELAGQYYKAYVFINGKGMTKDQLNAQIEQNYLTTIERASIAKKSVMALQDVARMRQMFDTIQKEQGQ